MFPSAFLERLQELGIDSAIYRKFPRKSVYILEKEEKIVSEFNLQPVGWADHSYWTDQPKKIQDDYYEKVFVQDAASIVPVLALDIGNKDVVLDLCAAPGSKTLHAAQKANHVIAVDAHRKRIKRLSHNVARFHIANCTVIRADGRKLCLDQKVDRVLVDAPCSGEGMVKKIDKVMKLWSVKRIRKLARLQKQLVKRGFSLLRKGGILVYSTCTFAPEENEAVVDYLLRRGGAELEPICKESLNCSFGLTRWRTQEYSPAMEKALRIYPFHNNTNAFFVARIRKTSE